MNDILHLCDQRIALNKEKKSSPNAFSKYKAGNCKREWRKLWYKVTAKDHHQDMSTQDQSLKTEITTFSQKELLYLTDGLNIVMTCTTSG